jgi:hypothetical protein
LHHPGKDDKTAWRPGNDFANEYTALWVIWENFSTFYKMAKTESNQYTRKLTLKSAVVELRSFLDAAPRLNNLLAALPAHDGVLPRRFVCLTDEERAGANAKYKLVNKSNGKILTRLRNHICAHQSKTLLKGAVGTNLKESVTWDELDSLWQQLEPAQFAGIAQAIDAWMAKLQHLPVYEYYKMESETRIRCFVPCVAEEVGTEMRLTALSPSLIRQIEALAPSSVVGSYIVFKREPLRLKVRWPPQMLKDFPELAGSTVEL